MLLACLILPSAYPPPQDDRQYREVTRTAEDRYSDASSGDTGASDSGRGGSEDEGHLHHDGGRL